MIDLVHCIEMYTYIVLSDLLWIAMFSMHRDIISRSEGKLVTLTVVVSFGLYDNRG